MKTPFYMLLYKVFQAQKNEIRPQASSVGLSPGQPKVLACLMHRKSYLQKELAEACGIKPATISSILDSMEQKGLINKCTAPGHRRAIEVTITSHGKDVYHKWVENCQIRVEKKALKGLSDEEVNALYKLLSRVYFNLTGNELE